MKRTVEVDFSKPLPEHALSLLRDRELILLDSNKLINLARGLEGGWLRKILLEWQRFGVKAVCAICDFVLRESKNAENWTLGKVTVQRLLKEVAESREGMYVEVATPIRNVEADARALFYNLLPKAERRLLLKAEDVSPTDKCLILIARYAERNGIHASITTEDLKLADLSKKLGVEVRL